MNIQDYLTWPVLLYLSVIVALSVYLILPYFRHECDVVGCHHPTDKFIFRRNLFYPHRKSIPENHLACVDFIFRRCTKCHDHVQLRIVVRDRHRGEIAQIRAKEDKSKGPKFQELCDLAGLNNESIRALLSVFQQKDPPSYVGRLHPQFGTPTTKAVVAIEPLPDDELTGKVSKPKKLLWLPHLWRSK